VYLHIFTDAGENAWSVAIYIRYFNDDTQKYESNLIYSTTRVAPTKTKLSVPKKELNGILLGVEKAIKLAKSLEIRKENIFIHTDSLVALTWINKDKNSLNVYVSNRVCKIQATKLKILFTPGCQNPADLCSKPKPSKEYINNIFWTSGPDYLKQPNKEWEEKYSWEKMMEKKLCEEDEKSVNLEIKKQKIKIQTTKFDSEKNQGIFSLIEKFNNLNKILNIVVQCFRAIAKLTGKMKNEKRKIQLTRGFQIERIDEKQRTLPAHEQQKLYSIPSIKELEFAKRFLII